MIMNTILQSFFVIWLIPTAMGEISYPIAKKTLAAVVRINVARSLDTALQSDSNYMSFVRKADKLSGEVVYGSGFIFHEEGYIATNLHVLGEEGARIHKITVNLSDGKSYPAKIIGYDRFFDVLVLKI